MSEFWWDGHALIFADGDVGPDNHESAAAHYLQETYLCDAEGEERERLQNVIRRERCAEYVMQELGWVKINQKRLGVWTFTRESVGRIRRAINAVLDDSPEVFEDEEIRDGDKYRWDLITWHLYSVDPEKIFYATLEELQSDSLGAQHVRPTAQSGIARAMDIANQLEFYGGRLGD